MARWGLLKSIVLIVLAFFLVSGTFTDYPGHEYWQAKKAGFLTGIIHGVLAPIMLVATLFTNYTMYELNNTGWFYNFGFLIGILITWSGSGTNNVIKNYYSSRQEKHKEKLSNEDEEKISKIVEEKVKSVIKNQKKNKPEKKLKNNEISVK